MDFEQLNMYYCRYRTSPTTYNFVDMYTEAKRLLRTLNRSKMRRSGYGDNDDADMVFNDVIMRMADRQVDDFGKALVRALSNGRIDHFRKEISRLKHVDSYTMVGDPDYEEDAPTSNVIPEAPADEYVFNRKKNTEDQRQLISRILESAKILFDPTTVTAVEGPDSDHVTVTAVNEIKSGANAFSVARSLGLQRNTVDRKILRLGRFLPEGCDIREYLPDSVYVKSEYIPA